MLSYLDKDVRTIETDDIREFLSYYQSNNNCNNLIIDEVRRSLSSFFTFHEVEDYIVKSPIRRIHKYQDDYDKTINNCNHNVESTEFVEFMLNRIGKVLDKAISTSSVPITETGIHINKLLSIMEYNVPMTTNEIMNKLSIKSKERLRST